MPKKLTSRKFWMAAIPTIVGIVTLIWGNAVGEQTGIIAGSVITLLASLGYLKVEGDIDKQNSGKK